VLKTKQRGLSIIELLIGMIISLIVIAAIIGIFANTIAGSQGVLQRGKLDRDLFAAMDIMANDIQRAGYWVNATSSTANPFMAGTNIITTNASTNCITFAYDRATDGAVSTNDQFGYGLSGNAIQFRQTGSPCASGGAGTGWVNLTDPNVITISAFQVTSTNVAVNAGTGTNATNYRTITITLTGNLNSDPTDTRSITRTINVYNNPYTP
jgi:prepilin peptidase dependent protein B